MNEAYKELKPHLKVVLRSKASQGEKLDNTIHTELCDMALLPVIQIKAERDDNSEEVKMIGYIKKNICEKMDVSEKQIMEDALNNTIVGYPPPCRDNA
ncbi:hypothetical protein BXO88_02800 [Oribacterium sp. C9]|uniref:hypothetical protein n=1 Tax=Oribacterium sp. C9 TaxID=1943579 RepID=UPI00098EFE31|nr:hypothetical protein [Oribacterium sp. C9]OON87623.1 hypothetical protein BXO88_02800 [Oribacterium sp. C9]